MYKDTQELPLRVLTFIREHALIMPHTTIVVGLSGGVDSVVLLHLLTVLQSELNCQLVAAHLDHEWHSNSAKAATFCKNYAQKLGIAFVQQQAHNLPREKLTVKGSVEATGRALRRYFLEQVAQQYDAAGIALAHHLQDQIETFFIRLLRGTTLAGLIGIKPVSNHYLRPLLATPKELLIAYAKKHDLAWIEDPTNQSDNFLRNRIRQHLIPELVAADERFEKNFVSTHKKLVAANEIVQAHITDAYAHIVKDGDINTALLATHPSFVQHALVLHWLVTHNLPFIPTESFLAEIIRFLISPRGGTHVLNEKWSLHKKQNRATIITKNNS